MARHSLQGLMTPKPSAKSQNRSLANCSTWPRATSSSPTSSCATIDVRAFPTTPSRRANCGFRFAECSIDSRPWPISKRRSAPSRLIGRLREVGKPFGRLRDAEILESSVIKALGERVATPQGRQLMELAARSRRAEQRVTDDLLGSDAYQKTLSEVSEFRAALPSRHATSEMLRPMAQRAMHLSWRELQREAKRGNAQSDEQTLASHPHRREENALCGSSPLGCARSARRGVRPARRRLSKVPRQAARPRHRLGVVPPGCTELPGTSQARHGARRRGGPPRQETGKALAPLLELGAGAPPRQTLVTRALH